MKDVFYTAPKIFNGEEWLYDQAIICTDSRIGDIVPLNTVSPDQNIVQFDNCLIAPAFIDLQIYGAYGKLLAVYPEPDSLEKLVDYCRKGGAAFCLPTLATNTKEVFYRGIDAVRKYWEEGKDGVLGLHLEGPWINPDKRGAHVESLIHKPGMEEVKELLDYGEGVIKMITLAPEVCDQEIIPYILSKGIILSAGHSNATYEEAKYSFNNGFSTVTHLFNAMSPFLHRQPGLAGAVIDDNSVCASIIADGYHVDYAAIRIAKKLMRERLFLITDAVTDTDQGYYKHQLAGDRYEANGVLSGSNLTMVKAVQNIIKFAAVEPGEAIRMASSYPAKILKLDHLGKIKPGSSARMVVLDENFEVKQML